MVARTPSGGAYYPAGGGGAYYHGGPYPSGYYYHYSYYYGHHSIIARSTLMVLAMSTIYRYGCYTCVKPSDLSYEPGPGGGAPTTTRCRGSISCHHATSFTIPEDQVGSSELAGRDTPTPVGTRGERGLLVEYV